MKQSRPGEGSHLLRSLWPHGRAGVSPGLQIAEPSVLLIPYVTAGYIRWKREGDTCFGASFTITFQSDSFQGPYPCTVTVSISLNPRSLMR